MIVTQRLRLIPATPESLEAELRGPDALARVLGMAVPPDWPPELYDADATRYTLERLRADPREQGWWLYYFAGHDGDAPRLVGCGGFKGPPDAGIVEIGYSVLEPYRRRGYATEATEALCRRAFENEGIFAVIAETLPELTPSIGVLERAGFERIGEGSAPGVVRYELTRVRWAERFVLRGPTDG
jgi:[ribosomal protein S5]-alanine N-acetyltransferase